MRREDDAPPGRQKFTPYETRVRAQRYPVRLLVRVALLVALLVTLLFAMTRTPDEFVADDEPMFVLAPPANVEVIHSFTGVIHSYPQI